VLALLWGCAGDDDGALPDGGFGEDSGADAGAPADVGPPDAGPLPDPVALSPRIAIEPDELGVLVNTADPQSVAIAEAYVGARGIPEANVVELEVPAGAMLSEEQFAPLKEAVDSALGEEIQGLAITWTQPFRVRCMSITSAFALGYDDIYCNTSGESCSTTASVPYFDTDTTRPFTDLGIRPAMMLAAADEASGLALVERGLAADDTFPEGDGWLVRTTDAARNVRWPQMLGMPDEWEGVVDFAYLDAVEGEGPNAVSGETGGLFYFTGLARVPDIETNEYLPGAVADHLTSFGGRVPTSGQMSVVEWLTAGATGSYGTVVEPCNFRQKFPNVPVMVSRYFRGATLLEAYWKSVLWPGEGLFVGDPLARPWGLQAARFEDGEVIFETNALAPGEPWVVESGASEDGPWEEVREVSVEGWGRAEIRVDATEPYYRLRRGE